MQESALVDELETVREVEYIEFELGDHVVYPHHGAGKVMKKELKEKYEGSEEKARSKS